MKKWKQALAFVLAMAMCASMLTVSAFAEGPDGAGGGEGGAPSGEGGGPGGGGGEQSSPVDLTGMLSLKQYVFVKSQGEIKNGSVSTTVYGAYTAGSEGEASYVTQAYSGEVKCDDPDVIAIIHGSTLTLSGVATTGNVAYSLTTRAGDYVTTIYVVNDEYNRDSATLTLADGTTVALTTYAPNMANGDYVADEGQNSVDESGNTSVYIGGNRTAVSVDDMTDLKDASEADKEVAAWYIQSGITNAGDSLTEFGKKMYTYEYAVGLYRLFQIVVDETTSVKGFADPKDFSGAMFSNDPYSDAVSATLQGAIWNGIYTQYSDTLSEDGGYYLTKNIDGVTELGATEQTTIKTAYVSVYNAYQSNWSSLNETGKELAEQMEAAAAQYEGESKAAPKDYSNAAKAYAVYATLLENASKFADDDGTGDWTWAADFIYYCQEAGIINGESKDGGYVYNAADNLTRAQAAKIIAEAYGLSSDATESSFKDVASDHWAVSYIEACKTADIINGREEDTFAPDDDVTRAELAKMIVQAEKLTADTSAEASFSDTGDHWAKAYIEACVSAGIVNGYEDGTFKPDNKITRAEAATLIAKSEISKSLPEVLNKVEAAAVLYACKDSVASKAAPDAAWAESVGSTKADFTQYFTKEYGANTTIVSDGTKNYNGSTNLISSEGAALLVKKGATVNVTNSTISLVGNADQAVAHILGLIDANRALDGAEAVLDPTHDGFVYNATTRNAFYRVGLGSALTLYGGDAVLTSNDGTLVLDGEATGGSSPASTMAGTAYVSYGGSMLVKNAVAYSSSQHLSNLLYNGTAHYIDSAAIGSGRVYSSDFWGGYQVFEDTIANGGNVTDEPTTLVVKNSVFGNSIGGNGFASQYFQNSILNVGTATFQNTTSLTTDTGSLTLVNSVLNSSASKLAATTGCERAIITLVDSTVNLNGNVLASVGNRSTLNAMSVSSSVKNDEAYVNEYYELLDGEMAIYFYGNVTMNTSSPLTVDVAEGATLTVYSANLTADNITNTGKGELKIVNDASYGTVTVDYPQA